MTDLQKSNLVRGLAIGAVVGVLLGAVVMYSLQEPSADDEDRPPIIVRGGSLIFESGDAKTSGKNWKQKSGTEWKQDHDKGHWVGYFAVSFDAPSTCAPVYTPELTVYFKPDGPGADTAFQITRQPRNNNGNDKKQEPVVIGQGLVAANSITNPTLTFNQKGSIARVDYKTPGGTGTCATPKEIRIELAR
ncbi:MAG TPA: hypothetical protein VNJ04_17185 [Gemmatimonadaceae bacterium]|nr:hypothetical protein [Gemmatimonadaceae bacterium]